MTAAAPPLERLYSRSSRGDVIHRRDCERKGRAVDWRFANDLELEQVLATIAAAPWLRACTACMVPAGQTAIQLEIGQALRDAGMQATTDADTADTAGRDAQLIDQAIDAAALTSRRTGRPFSANDIRPLIPAVRRPLVGARFMAAHRAGRIRKVGWTPSTDPGTHGHPIALWEAS